MYYRYTPAPWHWHKCRTQQHLQDANGSCFAGVSMPASNNKHGIWVEAGYREYMEANARLIALAPELLEAVIAMESVWGPSVDRYKNYDGKGGHGAGWEEIEAIEKARSLLKQARGEVA